MTVHDTVALVTRPDYGPGADGWEVALLPDRLGDDLEGLVSALRQGGGGGGALGLANLDNEVVVLVRVAPGGAGSPVRLVLSDLTAALAYDLAHDVVEALDLALPDEDDLDAVVPVGDTGMLADLGLSEQALVGLVSDPDSYADEVLSAVAGSLGFAGAWARVVEPAGP